MPKLNSLRGPTDCTHHLHQKREGEMILFENVVNFLEFYSLQVILLGKVISFIDKKETEIYILTIINEQMFR